MPLFGYITKTQIFKSNLDGLYWIEPKILLKFISINLHPPSTPNHVLCESLTTLNNWLLWQICVLLNFLRWINAICVTFIDFHSIIRIFGIIMVWGEKQSLLKPTKQTSFPLYSRLFCPDERIISNWSATAPLPPPLPHPRNCSFISIFAADIKSGKNRFSWLSAIRTSKVIFKRTLNL